MGIIKVIINRGSNTLDVWFDDAKKEFICEETRGEVILKASYQEKG